MPKFNKNPVKSGRKEGGKMDRIVKIVADAKVHPKNQSDADALRLLCQDLTVPIIAPLKGREGLYLFESHLEIFFKANPEHPARKLFNPESICPVCGTMAPYNFVKDYRDNDGCVGSIVTCKDCIYLPNKEFYELYGMADADKTKFVLNKILLS